MESDDTFVFPNGYNLDVDRDGITYVNGSQEFQSLPQVDGARSGQVIAQDSRDQRSDQESVCNSLAEEGALGILSIQMERIVVSAHLSEEKDVFFSNST